jgi:hypothetical protein
MMVMVMVMVIILELWKREERSVVLHIPTHRG